MSSLADRLRGIVGVRADSLAHPRLHQPEGGDRAERPDTDGADGADAVAEHLGGAWQERAGGRFLVVDRSYRPGHRHGRLVLVDHVLPEPDQWEQVLAGASCECAAARPAGEQRRLFIDLETTGLAGGAGTYAFLVGCGWFEGVAFRIRQYLLTSHAAERALLEAVAELAATCRLVVSYNGKTFDLPLIDTRFVMNRMPAPFTGVPHLDMLHPARRLWRASDSESITGAGCRLSALEQVVCGHVREDDVPGFEAPSRYFHFVRTGDPRSLAGVLEHNRLDLLSLAFLTARAARLVEDGPAAIRTAREALGLGRLYERAGLRTKARACFARATGLDGAQPLPGDDAFTAAEALRSYALVCRRERHFADAANAWQRLLALPDCPPGLRREATEALAVHHEHRLRDVRTAHAFAVQSLPLQGTMARTLALQHRLARLDRKMAQRVPQTALLF